MVQELRVEVAAAPMRKPGQTAEHGGSAPMDVDVDLDGVAAVLLAVGAGNYNSDSLSACASSVGILSSDDEGGAASAAAQLTPEHTPLLVAGEPVAAAEEELMPAASAASPLQQPLPAAAAKGPHGVPHAAEERRPSLLGSLADLATQELMSFGDTEAMPQGRLPAAAAAAGGDASGAAAAAQGEAAAADAGQAVPSRRQRPRSISCPEGMELQGWGYRAPAGSSFHVDSPSSERGAATAAAYATGTSSGGGGFGAIREEDEDDARALRSLRDVTVKPEASLLPRGGGGFAEGPLFGGGESCGGGEVGSDMSMLPHLLPRFSGVYNKHGRIGIYTRQEREAIISRFKSKRSRRVWRKKIRYSCRKNLADKRLRVKGRFVRMSAEQRAALEIELRAAAAADAAVEAADGGGGGASVGEPVTRRRSRGASLGSEADRGGYGGDRDEDEEQEGEEGGNGDDGEDGEGEQAGEEASEEELPPRGVRVRRHSIAF